MATPRSPRCPTCRATVQFEVGVARPPWAPFCSERCKLIDLGRWLGEEHRIAGPPADLDDLEGLEVLSRAPDFDEQ